MWYFLLVAMICTYAQAHERHHHEHHHPCQPDHGARGFPGTPGIPGVPGTPGTDTLSGVAEYIGSNFNGTSPGPPTADLINAILEAFRTSDGSIPINTSCLRYYRYGEFVNTLGIIATNFSNDGTYFYLPSNETTYSITYELMHANDTVNIEGIFVSNSSNRDDFRFYEPSFTVNFYPGAYLTSTIFLNASEGPYFAFGSIDGDDCDRGVAGYFTKMTIFTV